MLGKKEEIIGNDENDSEYSKIINLKYGKEKKVDLVEDMVIREISTDDNGDRRIPL